MTRRPRRLLIATLLALIPGCPCTTTPPVDPGTRPTIKPDEVLVPGEGVSPETAPSTTLTAAGRSFVSQVYQGLTRFDENLLVLPALAESWQASEDLRTWTFVLRAGLMFHDGSPLTTAEVIRSLEEVVRHCPDDSFWLVEGIAGARIYRAEKHRSMVIGFRAVDPLTLEVQLDRPDGLLPAHFAAPQLGIFRRTDAVPPFKAVGAGPFQNDHVDAGHVIVVPFAGFHGEARARATLRFAGTAPVGTGGLHVGPTRDAEMPGGIEVKTCPSLSTTYAAFSPDVPLAVRQIVNRALDRAAYCSDVRRGLSVPAHGVLPPALRAARPMPLVFDVAPALSASYTLNATLDEQLLATVEKALAPLNVVLVSDRTKPMQLIQSTWVADLPDPDDFLRVLFHSTSLHNLGRYANPEVDALLEKARAFMDLEDPARLELYRKVEEQLIAEQPWLFLWHDVNRVAVLPPVRGVRVCAFDREGCLVLPQVELTR